LRTLTSISQVLKKLETLSSFVIEECPDYLPLVDLLMKFNSGMFLGRLLILYSYS
jgi:hypothetical protein